VTLYDMKVSIGRWWGVCLVITADVCDCLLDTARAAVSVKSRPRDGEVRCGDVRRYLEHSWFGRRGNVLGQGRLTLSLPGAIFRSEVIHSPIGRGASRPSCSGITPVDLLI
jgi:hypothetical protein